jgi:dTDP-glucose pyrophosphorylase
MITYKEHLILRGSKIKEALEKLNYLSQDAILFVIDENEKLIGSLTDGDVRRGLLKDFTVNSIIDDIIQENPRFVIKGENSISKIIKFREENYKIIPVLNTAGKVINAINFRYLKSYLPIDVVIMAGGRGLRLQPLTDKTPKPLLPVGNKPIIEHNIDRLSKYGIHNFWISIKYLGEQIENYFDDGNKKNITIKYVHENEPLGTIGAISNIIDYNHEFVLVTNSDLLTNVDYEHFFLDFVKNNADLSVLTIPYQVSIPYAVLDTNNNIINGIKEKPTFNYYSNGGIYLFKKEMLRFIPKNSFYNTTDLIEELISRNYKVISYPFSGYWLDIGKHDDYQKANIDIQNYKFE